MGIISTNAQYVRGGHTLLDFSSLQSNYSSALAWAKDETLNAAVGQFIYISEDQTIKNEESGESTFYSSGPYIVTAIGANAVLTKLASSTASGDLSSDIQALQTQLNRCDFEDSSNNNGVEVSLKQVDGKVESISVDASELDAAAQSYADAAISAAASDATSKANSAEANAKSYADGKVNELKNSLSNALHFLGVSTTDPSTGVVTIGGTEVTTFSDGDIVIFGSKEFVRSNGAWEELGDVTGVSELLTWNDEA